MGIAGSPDIFQAKMLELMVALEFVKTYLDGLLCITQVSLDDHLKSYGRYLPDCEKWAAGLKVNAQKSKFCGKDTEYLGYALTTDGIKPQQKRSGNPRTHTANWSQRPP